MPEQQPTISVFGLQLPISRWSLGGFSLLALAAVALVLWRQLYPTDLVSLKQANAQLAFSVNEYGRHLTDTPERAFSDIDGTLNVQVYKDHCVAIQYRDVAKGVQTRLIPDPSRVADAAALKIGRYWPTLEPTVVAQGRCLNPHPGPFDTKYGARNGCIVEVWRGFADGCVHVQLMNSCNGSFDTNPDGSPRVRWTRCIH
jgi:hypothetical protein